MLKVVPRIHVPDYSLIVGFVILLISGLIMLTSSSYFIGCQKLNNCYFYLKHQLLYGLFPGLIILFLLSHFDYRRLKKIAVPILVGVILLLVLVLLPELGVVKRGSQRWLKIGSITFQPSEAIKLAFLLFLSAWLSKEKTDIKNFRRVFIPFVILLVIVSALIIPQKDLSTLIIVISPALVVYFLAGAPFLHFGYLFMGLILAVAAAIKYEPYRLQRLLVFSKTSDVDVSGVGYHINQALSAIGSGGIFGKGLGLSQLNRNPESRDDKRPRLSDIRESGSFEQDADKVFFVYRHWWYHKDTANKNDMEVLFEKNRQGEIGTGHLIFYPETTRFADKKWYPKED